MQAKNKRRLQTSLILVGAYLLYDLYYRYKNSLLTSNNQEEELELDQVLLPLHWLSEQDYQEQIDQVLKQLAVHKTSHRLDLEPGPLVYQVYTPRQVKGRVILVHGFNEFKERYQESVYYFFQAGFQVVVYDQRGHGESRTNLEERQIDVASFEAYVSDLDLLVDVMAAKEDLATYLFGHSMGGAVVAKYLQEHPGKVQAAILSSPMFSINTWHIPESMTYLYSQLANLGLGQQPVPAIDTYVPGYQHHILPSPEIGKSGERAEYYTQLKSAIYEYPTRGVSIQWLNTSLEAIHQLLDNHALRSITEPVLIIRSGNDQIVNAEGIYTASQGIPKARSLVIPGADHEIDLEADRVVHAYFNEMILFLLKNNFNDKVRRAKL
ncbi:alpha/beta fold hydrolase [Hutsoniella sourekii]